MNTEEIRREIENRRKISPWFDEILPKPIGICETGGLVIGKEERRLLLNKEYFRRIKVRANDRDYFRRELGEFIERKEIHHFWQEGDRCLLLSVEEHDELHKVLGINI